MRITWWYIGRCIRFGRLRAAIPEAAFAAEVLPIVDRISALVAAGTPEAVKTTAKIDPARRAIVEVALQMGFRVLHGPRIAWGEFIDIHIDQWARDERFSVVERQQRQSDFIRHFGDYPLERLKDLGETLASPHGLAAGRHDLARAAATIGITIDRYLSDKGLEAEELAPRQHSSVEAFRKRIRAIMSDWQT